MSPTKTVEVFSAGCPTCREVVELVKRIASSGREVIVHDMQKSDGASKAHQYGVRSVPAVVVEANSLGAAPGVGRTRRLCVPLLPSLWRPGSNDSGPHCFQ